jgi:hypothetical protein
MPPTPNLPTPFDRNAPGACIVGLRPCMPNVKELLFPTTGSPSRR